MTPRTPLVLAVALFLCAGVSRAAPTYDASWENASSAGIDSARDKARELQANQIPKPAAGDETSCLQFGAHLDALPEVDILSDFRPAGSSVAPMCRTDPYANPGEYQAALEQLRARIIAKDPRVTPYKAPTGETGFEKVIGTGLAKLDEVSADKFWGNIEVAWLADDMRTSRGTTVVVYRAYLEHSWNGPDRVRATRYDYNAFWDGTLSLVQRTTAEITPPFTIINWGDSVALDATNAVEIIRWHQLVDAMNRGL